MLRESGVSTTPTVTTRNRVSMAGITGRHACEACGMHCRMPPRTRRYQNLWAGSAQICAWSNQCFHSPYFPTCLHFHVPNHYACRSGSASVFPSISLVKMAVCQHLSQRKHRTKPTLVPHAAMNRFSDPFCICIRFLNRWESRPRKPASSIEPHY
jgi:hypothetical protein